MRVALALSLTFAGMCVPLPAAETHADAATLIARIPSEDKLDELRKQTESANPIEKQQARKVMRSAIADFRELKSLLKVGSFVFDYPGLLALPRMGVPSYDPRKHLYTLPFGAYTTDPGEPGQFFFRLTFDEKGIIREVKPFMLLM